MPNSRSSYSPAMLSQLASVGQAARATQSETVDAYLAVTAKRAGRLKGESLASGFEDQSIVTGWSWGIAASSAIGNTSQTARRSYTALTVHKRIDSASTGLMSALVTNDEIKEARLTLRRAGGAQEVFFTITLSSARLTDIRQSTDASGEAIESLTFTFTKVQAEYTPQQSTGMRGATMVFNDELPSTGA